VSDLHEVVVYYVRKVICRETVRLQQDGVFVGRFGDMAASLEGSEGAIDEVLVCRVLIWNSEAYGVRFPFGCSVIAFFFGYSRWGACAVIVRCDAQLVSVFG
jgi:hypothetical protein